MGALFGKYGFSSLFIVASSGFVVISQFFFLLHLTGRYGALWRMNEETAARETGGRQSTFGRVAGRTAATFRASPNITSLGSHRIIPSLHGFDWV